MHSDDSDQPVHSCSLIRIFTGCILDSRGCKVSSCRIITLIKLHSENVPLNMCAHCYVFSCCGSNAYKVWTFFQLAASLDPVEVKSGSAISMVNASLVVKDNKYVLEVCIFIMNLA